MLNDAQNKINELKSYIEQEYFNAFLQKTYSCKALIQNAKPEMANYLKTESPDFNIFTITGLHRYEVNTHTSFLAELLSPVGTHNQHELFLTGFLRDVLNFSNDTASHPSWYIIKEKEYIDLRIVNDILKKAVLIENKIDTVAHSGQLSRYYKTWFNRYGDGAFIYLTINGDQPPDQGFDDSIYPKSEIETNLRLLSYRHDISRWLQSCKNDIQSPKVFQTVSQYIDAINYL